MRKKIMKFLALLLSAALVLGSVNITSAIVQAGTGEGAQAVSGGDVSGGDVSGGEVATPTARYYTFKDVTQASGGWGCTPAIDATTGVNSLSFSGQYAEVKYTLPAGVDVTTLTKVALDVSEGTATNLSLKIYIDGAEKQVKYGANAITIDDATAALLATATTVDLGIMNSASAAADYVIDNILITAVQTGGSETEPSVGGGEEGGEEGGETATESTKYYTFKDVTRTSGYGDTPSVDENGVLTLGLAKNYQEIQYSLPAGVDGATLKNITFDITSANVSDLAIKILKDGAQAQVVYETNSINVTADLSTGTIGFALMNKNTEVDITDMVIENIKITAVQTGGSETEPSVGGGEEGGEEGGETASESTKYYTFKDVTRTGGYGDTPVVDENGVLTLGLAKNYQEIQYSLPAGVDGATLKSITFDVTTDNVADLAIKILKDGAQAQVVYGTNTITVTADVSTGTIGFALMNKNTEADIVDMVIENIKITAVQTGGSDTEPSVGGGEEGGEEGGETATESTKYYTFKDVTRTGGYGDTPVVDENGVLTLGLAKNYQEIQYSLPAGVDATTLKSITFDVTTDNVADLAIKILKDGAQAQVAYGTNTITVTADVSTGTIGFALMNKNTEADIVDMVIENIKITAVQTGGSATKPGAGGSTGGGTETPDVPAENEYFVTFDALTQTGLSEGATADVDADGKLALACPGQYNEVKFSLPMEMADGRAIANLTKIKLDVAEGTASNLSVKIYVDGNEVQAAYGNTVISPSVATKELLATATSVGIGIMNQSTDAGEWTIDKVVLTVPEPEAPIQSYEKTFTAAELTLGSTNATTCELTDAGWAMTFSELNLETSFTLPTTFNLEDCISVTFTVASQTGPVNYHLTMDGTKVKNFWYNTTTTTLEPESTKKANGFSIQCGGETYTEGSAIVFESITFKMKGTEPLEKPADDVYAPAYFEVVEYDAGVVVTPAATVDDPMVVEFPGEGDSVILTIPEYIDVNHLVSIDFNITAASPIAAFGLALPNVKIALLNENKQEIMSTTEDTIRTDCNGDVKYIKLTATGDAVAIQLNNVTFNVDENAFSTIILNGSFTNSDMTSWSKEASSAVITAKTSATPIGDTDITTYGEITGRGSNYNCFAQDVSARVEAGKLYSFGFWAMLSDDYADAAANMREITFNPYSKNASGTAKYGLKVEGGTKTLEVGVWTYISGTVEVPSDAEEFIVRIMEQGTNYGSGPGVQGTYYITGVEMNEIYTVPPSNEGNPAVRPIGYSVTYTAEDLAIETVAASTEIVDGKIKIYFNQQYAEAKFKLPRALDMSDIVYITLKAEGQSVPIAVKLYNKGTMELVNYFNNYQSEYKIVPYLNKNINQFGIMSLKCSVPGEETAVIESITFHLTEEPDPIPVSKDIVANGFFNGEDISDWQAAFWGDGVTMAQAVSATPIYDDVYTYGAYSKRTSPYQCFAQDITGKVEQNETYTFSFWARLSNDYVGAPDVQRVVQFAPYTVDKDGNPDYNPKLEGTYSQVLEPGVWTKFEGKYKVTNANDIGQVFIRILEQGTNYGQGDCVMGAYDVTAVVIEKYIPEPPSIDEDVPALKDAITEVMGDGFIVGTALAGNEPDDIGVEMLVNKHFNAVTIGNELKPDALFGYSNYEHTKLQTITFNGQELVVPTLDYSRAEMILDELKKWNETHPEEPIKVRGHVLVWHAQTPEWFFRENYVVDQRADGSENYVTPEVMNLRLEWFIKTVLEHFTGPDSEYKDMFYGWDVVNEAIGDGGKGYRTDKVTNREPLSNATHSSNSSWWAVYQSNEYIIKAFQYANKYAPADVELYYNDYNDADSKKVTGIVALLKAVKEAEGTRIDAMGMQGHYNLFNPSNKSIENAIRSYAEVVGAVQYTEFDFKASGNISNASGLQAEYLAQAERYHEIYLLLQKLDKEEGIDITGFTVWGTVDQYSWLQKATDIGGGSEVQMDQCPLLFDSNYKVKPSYWAFVDYTQVDPDWTPEVEQPKKEDKEDKDDQKAEDKTDDKADTSTEESKTEESKETENATESDSTDKVVTDTAVGGDTVKKSNPWPIVAVAAVIVLAVAAAGVVVLKRKKK